MKLREILNKEILIKKKKKRKKKKRAGEDS